MAALLLVCNSMIIWYGIKAGRMGLPKMRWALCGAVVSLGIWIMASNIAWLLMPDYIYTFYQYVLAATITVVGTRKIGLYLLERVRLPEFVDCAACGMELELDMQERQEQRFQCSECGHTSNMREQLYAQLIAPSNQTVIS